MSSLYNQEQIQDSITGYLWYDAPWGIIRAAYPFIGNICMDIGSGSGIMMNVIKILKDAEQKHFEFNLHEGELTDSYWLRSIENKFDTVFTSHVLEHIKNFDDMVSLIDKSIDISGGRIIHIVPDGDVQDKNTGTEHIRIFNRVNFIKLFCKYEDSGRLKRIHYGPIKGDRMDSLMYVGEVVK